VDYADLADLEIENTRKALLAKHASRPKEQPSTHCKNCGQLLDEKSLPSYCDIDCRADYEKRVARYKANGIVL
jgi:hypothetical protein